MSSYFLEMRLVNWNFALSVRIHVTGKYSPVNNLHVMKPFPMIPLGHRKCVCCMPCSYQNGLSLISQDPELVIIGSSSVIIFQKCPPKCGKPHDDKPSPDGRFIIRIILRYIIKSNMAMENHPCHLADYQRVYIPYYPIINHYHWQFITMNYSPCVCCQPLYIIYYYLP